MKKQIVSYNVAAWRWRVTKEPYIERLIRSCREIKDKAPHAFIIALQEIILGEKYLEIIEEEFPEYKVILPKAYDIHKNRKSAISIMLINTKGLKSYSLRTIEGLEDSARYNYVSIDSGFGSYRVLNINIPQTVFNNNSAKCYRESRISLRENFQKAILNEAMVYRDEKDIAFILLGDFNSTPKSPLIINLSNNPMQPMYDLTKESDKCKSTWINSEVGAESKIDYIFYSAGMMMSDLIKMHSTDVYCSTIKANMSDHALLIGNLDIA